MLPYDSKKRPENGVALYCEIGGYIIFVAKGLIDWRICEWRFTEPRNEDECRAILDEVVNAEFLLYYKTLDVRGPDGALLRKASSL